MYDSVRRCILNNARYIGDGFERERERNLLSSFTFCLFNVASRRTRRMRNRAERISIKSFSRSPLEWSVRLIRLIDPTLYSSRSLSFSLSLSVCVCLSFCCRTFPFAFSIVLALVQTRLTSNLYAMHFCLTLERTWLAAHNNISCVSPSDKYLSFPLSLNSLSSSIIYSSPVRPFDSLIDITV